MESIYQRLGAIHNCTSEEIRAEIEKAIKAGADNSDPDTKEKWKSISDIGTVPTVEDVIAYCALEAIRRIIN